MKNIFLLVIFFSFFSNIFSQNSNYHWYENNDKLYINRHQPSYLWVSTTPDNNNEDILLKSQKSKAYTNPMYFDTDGFNTIQYSYAVDTTTRKRVYPPKQVIFKVYVDGYDPITKAHFYGTRKYYGNGKIVYSKNLKIKLTAEDGLSGIDKIMFSLNDSDYKEYSEKLVFSEDGEFKFMFYALDNTGNRSKIKTYNFVIE